MTASSTLRRTGYRIKPGGGENGEANVQIEHDPQYDMAFGVSRGHIPIQGMRVARSGRLQLCHQTSACLGYPTGASIAQASVSLV